MHASKLTTALWIIPLLLVGDLLYVRHLLVHPEYYSDAYEDSFQAAALWLLLAIVLLIRFIILLWNRSPQPHR